MSYHFEHWTVLLGSWQSRSLFSMLVRNRKFQLYSGAVPGYQMDNYIVAGPDKHDYFRRTRLRGNFRQTRSIRSPGRECTVVPHRFKSSRRDVSRTYRVTGALIRRQGGKFAGRRGPWIVLLYTRYALNGTLDCSGREFNHQFNMEKQVARREVRVDRTSPR